MAKGGQNRLLWFTGSRPWAEKKSFDVLTQRERERERNCLLCIAKRTIALKSFFPILILKSCGNSFTVFKCNVK